MDFRSLISSFISYLTNLTDVAWLADLITAVLILLITAIVCHLVIKAADKIIHAHESIPDSTLILNVFRVVIWAIGISAMLDGVYGINVSAVLTALGIGGIAISLGAQDTLKNFIGGVQVTLMGLVKPGEFIEISGVKGCVKDVTWHHTTIVDAAGQELIIPNSVISTTIFTRCTDGDLVKVPFTVVTYKSGTNLDEFAKKLARKAKQAAHDVSPATKDPKVFFTEITEFTLKGHINVYVDDATKAAYVRNVVLKAIAEDVLV